MTHPALLLLDEADNVLVVRRAIRAGEALSIDGVAVAAPTDVAVGHKLARRDLTTGTPILKFGARIGVLVQDVACGGHVHTHNLASEYLPVHGRGGGTAS